MTYIRTYLVCEGICTCTHVEFYMHGKRACVHVHLASSTYVHIGRSMPASMQTCALCANNMAAVVFKFVRTFLSLLSTSLDLYVRIFTPFLM